MKGTNRDIRERVFRQLSRAAKPLSADALAAALRLKKADKPRLLLALAQMEKSGKIQRNKKGKYLAGSGEKTVRARMLSLNRGFGFARLEGRREDCFIAGRYLLDAQPGDTVAVRLGAPDSRGTQGVVAAVIEPGLRVYAGRLTEDKRKGLLVEADSGFRYPLPVRSCKAEGARPGDKVRFTVKQGKDGDWAAVVRAVYGAADSARVCADAILDSREIPTVFPDAVLEQAAALNAAGISEKELEGREDLRAWPIFTIDGPDAKDLDDAVSLEKRPDGWLLGVHIADVSHYVPMGSPLDEEALRRRTSVYFADRVVPMLPEALSNGACSLNAGEDKLAFSALLTLDADGACRDARLVKSVIRSKVRGVYGEVNALFNGSADDGVRKKYEAVLPILLEMRELAARLRQAAEGRGTMDLISVETRFVLDGEGRPIELLPRTTGEAEALIEQFMIAANVAVAALARRRRLPFVYRVHEHPDTEKLAALMEAARLLGFKTPLQAEELPQAALRDLMEQARETPYARLISDRILRAMAKAQYSDNPLGHYGLALKDYCHFTSPIRRYPDLAIHRILSDYLARTPLKELADRYGAFARQAADASSACEIRAMTAERDCEACYKAEYMRAHLGETFEGIIVSLSDFGLFVELPNTVSGLVPVEALPELELRFDDMASLVDGTGRRRYTIGQALAVKAASCDVSMGRVNFVPAAD